VEKFKGKINLDDYKVSKVSKLDKSIKHTFDIEVEDVHHYKLDNGIVSHNTISYIADTSSGIEPVFALAYSRKIEKTNSEYEVVYITDSVFEDYINKHYPNNKTEILESVSKNGGSCQKCKILTKEDKSIFITATDLTPMEHLNALGRAAKNTSLSISKTINLPKDISKEKVSDVYIEAYKQGIIGVTVYRDGSRDGILTTENKESEKNETANRAAPKRPVKIDCEVNITSVNKKQYYVIIGLVDNEPYEVFTGENYNSEGDIFIPKSVKFGKLKKKNKGEYILIAGNNEYRVGGSHSIPEVEALSRQISLNMRHFVPLQFIVEQLLKGNYLTAFHKSIARTLKKYIKEHAESTEKCPDCGDRMVYESGCISCKSCGYSKCS